jgi:hypothetical protein
MHGNPKGGIFALIYIFKTAFGCDLHIFGCNWSDIVSGI